MDKMEELERLARVALKDRDWFPSDFGHGFLMREDAALIAAAGPEVILRLVAIARAAEKAKSTLEALDPQHPHSMETRALAALREALKDPQ